MMREKRDFDVYLPNGLMYFGIALIAVSVVFGIIIASVSIAPALAVAVIGIGIGCAACLCCENQCIKMISDDSFEYRTFLGHKRTYRFSDITSVRRNTDSITIFCGKDKIHIESMAIVSKRFAEKLEKVIPETRYGSEKKA